MLGLRGSGQGLRPAWGGELAACADMGHPGDPGLSALSGALTGVRDQGGEDSLGGGKESVDHAVGHRCNRSFLSLTRNSP